MQVKKQNLILILLKYLYRIQKHVFGEFGNEIWFLKLDFLFKDYVENMRYLMKLLILIAVDLIRLKSLK